MSSGLVGSLPPIRRPPLHHLQLFPPPSHPRNPRSPQTPSWKSSNKPEPNTTATSSATSSCPTTSISSSSPNPMKSSQPGHQVIKQRFSKTRPESEVWESRYYDFNVKTEEKRAEKLHYIHQNPVRRGLVIDPADYPWSSHNHLNPKTPGPIHLTRTSSSGCPILDAVSSRQGGVSFAAANDRILQSGRRSQTRGSVAVPMWEMHVARLIRDNSPSAIEDVMPSGKVRPVMSTTARE